MNENEFKDAMASLAAGVSVVTYHFRETYGGLTVTSFTSVSMNPPIVLFCLQKGLGSDGPIQESGAFAVNMLSSGQQDISNGFAGKTEKHELVKSCGYTEGKTGAPVLDNCLATLDCKVDKVLDGGDHWIITGKVVEAASNPDKKPLLYYRRGYKNITD